MSTPAPAGAVAAFASPMRGRPAAARSARLADLRPGQLAASHPERLAAPRPALAAPLRPEPFVSATVLETDRILRRLAALGSVLILPLARAAAALTEHTAWQACSFRTQADFTRERLGRDSRWLRQLVGFHRTLERFPALAQAVTGADGQSPLGQVAAMLVGRVATPEDVGSWIDRARQLSLEELRALVRSASAAGEPSSLDPGTDEKPDATPLPAQDGESPEGAPSSCDRGSDLSDLDDESRVRLRFSVPPDVRWIFEAGLELYRSVEGWEAGISGFAPALVGEATSAGCVPPDDFRPRWQSKGGAGREGEVLQQRAAEALRGEKRRWGTGEQQPGEAERPGAGSFSSRGGYWNGPAIVLSLHTPAMRRALERLALFDLLRSRLRRLERKLASVPKAGSKTRTRDLRRLVVVFQVLVRMQDEIQIDMAGLLLELHDRRKWKSLGFPSLEAYAVARLGMGGSTAQQRVGLARRLPRLGVVRHAYERGKIGTEAAGHLVRRMQHLPADEALQRRWLAHVLPLTVKRLREEWRLERRQMLLAMVALACAMTPGYSGSTPGKRDLGKVQPDWPGTGDDPCQNPRRFPLAEDAGQAPKPGSTDSRSRNPVLPPPVPMDDATWQRSLLRYPGDICDQTFALAHGLLERVVRKGPLLQVPLVFALPEEDATALQGCIEAARRALSGPDDERISPADDSHLPPSARIARHFVRRHERVPEWVGLLALLEEWVLEHDGKAPRRPVDPILARDARCMAPGCTSRAQLEVHHLRYRSQGGSDAPDNLILLCAFHHRQGEHGGLASCRGKAPLDVVWRLGRGELAVWYQNERRMPRRK